MKKILFYFLLLSINTLYAQPMTNHTIDDLMHEAHNLEKTKNFDLAIHNYLEIIEILNDSTNSDHIKDLPFIYFNLACNYSAENKTNKALDAIKKALSDYSYSDFYSVCGDERLLNILENEKFKEILYKANSKISLNKSKDKTLISAPKSYNPKQTYPLIIALHGRGDNAKGFMESWKKLTDSLQVIVACPEGPIRAGKRIHTWDAPIEVLENILNKTINTCKEKYNIDVSKIVLSGFSQGGYLTYFLGLRNYYKFVGLMPVSSYFERNNLVSCLEMAKGSALKVYSIIGSFDDPSFIGSNILAKTILQNNGLDVQLKICDGIEHNFEKIPKDEIIKGITYLIE